MTGAVAGIGARLGAFVIDSLIAVGIAIVSTGPPPSSRYNLVVYLSFLAIEFVFVSVAGQTPGMRVLRIAVVRFADGGRPRPVWVLVRTLLLAVVLPALVVDTTGRAMHDRAANTMLVRTP
ncbi:MAG: hypothetical protein QOJ03_213 [Frankiaceae bacterium]|jgi:uncharacterized RDD family membrane protein YckC|nr:hypothetical protein [Frankiaceae bacterium]